jgi:uncharacterized membrane-anchored protein YjiN (DUF445 family)
MSDIDDDQHGLRKILGHLLGNLGESLMLDQESRSIMETHFLKGQAEILAGYQEVIARRLQNTSVNKHTRKVPVD